MNNSGTRPILSFFFAKHDFDDTIKYIYHVRYFRVPHDMCIMMAKHREEVRTAERSCLRVCYLYRALHEDLSEGEMDSGYNIKLVREEKKGK